MLRSFQAENPLHDWLLGLLNDAKVGIVFYQLVKSEDKEFNRCTFISMLYFVPTPPSLRRDRTPLSLQISMTLAHLPWIPVGSCSTILSHASKGLHCRLFVNCFKATTREMFNALSMEQWSLSVTVRALQQKNWRKS